MQFNELSAKEKAEKTYKDIQKRKEAKEKGRRDANVHLHINSLRIKNALAVRYIKRQMY